MVGIQSSVWRMCMLLCLFLLLFVGVGVMVVAGHWYYTTLRRKSERALCGCQDAVGVRREREPGSDGESRGNTCAGWFGVVWVVSNDGVVSMQ